MADFMQISPLFESRCGLRMQKLSKPHGGSIKCACWDLSMQKLLKQRQRRRRLCLNSLSAGHCQPPPSLNECRRFVRALGGDRDGFMSDYSEMRVKTRISNSRTNLIGH